MGHVENTQDMKVGMDLKQPDPWPQSAQRSRVSINPLNYPLNYVSDELCMFVVAC